MAWFKRKNDGILTSTEEKLDVPDGIWNKCPSCKKPLYTSDLEARLIRHNDGMVRSTKARRPFSIHYFEVFETKTEALKRENFFKSIDGYNWLKENKIT